MPLCTDTKFQRRYNTHWNPYEAGNNQKPDPVRTRGGFKFKYLQSHPNKEGQQSDHGGPSEEAEGTSPIQRGQHSLMNGDPTLPNLPILIFPRSQRAEVLCEILSNAGGKF